MGIKLFAKIKGEPMYLVEWKTGYIQFWEDWSQFLRPERYNWLNFRPIWFEVDYEKMAGEHLGIEFGLAGFNLRFHQFIRDNESGKEMRKETLKIESIIDARKKEVKKLKNKVVVLKKKLKIIQKV